jgi:hypothetical protein
MTSNIWGSSVRELVSYHHSGAWNFEVAPTFLEKKRKEKKKKSGLH